jgi:hypothetical protein
MFTRREEVVRTLRSRGEHDRALQAECALPKWVDLDADAGLLLAVDVDIAELREEDP